MTEKANKDILKNFFKSQQDMRRLATNENGFNNSSIKIIQEILRLCTICNIFEIPTLDLIDKDVSEEATKIIESNDEIEALERLNSFEISKLKLPSPCTYIGFPEYGPFNVVRHELTFKTFVTGVLITNESMFIFSRLVEDTHNQIYSVHGFDVLYKDNQWFPYSDEYNSITAFKSFHLIVELLNIINSFQTVVIDTRSAGFKLSCNLYDKKRQASRPKAYYRVTMRDGTRYLTDQEINDRLRIARECTYAYFVKAHNKHRILRGMMPMDEKTEAYLRKDPRRRIFTSQDEIDPDSLEILTKRGIFWKDGEWISLLPYRVSAHIANSKDGTNPYVPSIHVVP